jgi:hypothetical protein
MNSLFSRANRSSLGFLALLSAPAFALTPPQSHRELSADRPGSTEAPFTVPHGMWQIESSFFSFSKDDTGGTDFESWVVGEANVKFGLTDHSDLQLVLTPYVYERERSAMGLTDVEGIGDVELRFKHNLWGNDGGATAAGLLPYVKIPTSTDVSNDEWEGGLIVPFAWDFAENLGLGLQAEVARNFEDGAGHYWALSYTAVLGISITEQLGLYLEYAGTVSELPYESLASAGITYQVNDNLQFDVGGLLGLNNPSQDLSVFSGVTVRF